MRGGLQQRLWVIDEAVGKFRLKIEREAHRSERRRNEAAEEAGRLAAIGPRGWKGRLEAVPTLLWYLVFYALGMALSLLVVGAVEGWLAARKQVPGAR